MLFRSDNNTPAEIIDTLIISTLDGGLDIIPYMYKNDISIFQKQYLELVENFLFIVLNKNYLK